MVVVVVGASVVVVVVVSSSLGQPRRPPGIWRCFEPNFDFVRWELVKSDQLDCEVRIRRETETGLKLVYNERGLLHRRLISVSQTDFAPQRSPPHLVMVVARW